MSLFGGPTRKKVNLSDLLHHDLSSYALAAGIAGVSALSATKPAEAEIVYTPAHSVLSHDGVIRIELNHDGLTDLLIREIPCEHSVFSCNSLQAAPQSGGGVKRGLSHEGAAAMALGSMIGPRDPFDAGPGVMLNVSGIYYYGSWAGFDITRFVGIRFQINGETHYGWARLTVRFGTYSYVDALLTGYAYDTIPDKPIVAGDTGSANEVNLRASGELLREPKMSTLGDLALGANHLDIRRRLELQSE